MKFIEKSKEEGDLRRVGKGLTVELSEKKDKRADEYLGSRVPRL